MSLNNCSKSFHTSEVLLRPRLWHIVSVLAVLAVAVDGVAAVPVPVSASKAISRPVELKVRGSATANDWLLLLSIRFEFPSIEMVADSSWPLVAGAGTHGRKGGRGGRETPCPGGQGGAGGSTPAVPVAVGGPGGHGGGATVAALPECWSSWGQGAGRRGGRGSARTQGGRAQRQPRLWSAVALGCSLQGRRAQRQPRLRSAVALGRRDAGRKGASAVALAQRRRRGRGSGRRLGARAGEVATPVTA
jgi:hypothetical protein